ncbi:MAG: 3'-5' exonuclease [Acidobacterium ailaaui]|nr:3'-5' exonuclease [Pseudacidobacterium ailaaui]
MTERQTIVIDVETTGLDPDEDIVVEVSWWNLDTGDTGTFIPRHSERKVLRPENAPALRVNRYLDRILGQDQDNGPAADDLKEMLEGNTLAGSNPAFDAAFLRRMYTEQYGWEPPRHHHRLLDLSAYAAGVLGLPWSELPGLATVCELVGVELTDAHTARGDVKATGECFLRLREMSKR